MILAKMTPDAVAIENATAPRKKMPKAFLEKSLACAKASDAEAFQKLSKSQIEISLELYRTLSTDSLVFFFSIYSGKSFSDYTDFCARNNLLCMVEEDFVAAAAKF